MVFFGGWYESSVKGNPHFFGRRGVSEALAQHSGFCGCDSRHSGRACPGCSSPSREGFYRVESPGRDAEREEFMGSLERSEEEPWLGNRDGFPGRFLFIRWIL